MNKLTDIYREFNINIKNVDKKDNKIILNFTGNHNNHNALCSGVLNFTLIQNQMDNKSTMVGKKRDWVVDSNVSITLPNNVESYSVKHTMYVKTNDGTLLTNNDLFLAVFGTPTNNACNSTNKNKDNYDVLKICRMKSFLNLDKLVLAAYIFKQSVPTTKNQIPIINFKSTSFSNPNTIRWVESTESMDSEFQLRPITDIVGENKAGKELAKKLNSLKTNPHIIVRLTKGKTSNFWTGNYTWNFDDKMQFSNIETFNVNYSSEVDFEYNMNATDMDNLINNKITNAKVQWSFASSGEKGIDNLRVSFLNNVFETSEIYEEPIISFNSSSNYSNKTITWEESIDNLDKRFQLRPITNIKGHNESGKIIAQKLNNLSLSPYVCVNLEKGKESDFWSGNYCWMFDDATQFSNIQSFNVNYTSSSNKPYEYEIPVVDVNNIFSNTLSTAKIEWSFVGVGEEGSDSMKVTFSKNSFKKLMENEKEPIISFESPSFSHPDTINFNENTEKLDKIFQLRAIKNIKGVNDSGKRLAKKLNDIKLQPYIVINLVKGKESEVWNGNYSFTFDDATQFCNIEVFNINYSSEIDFEYELPVTDVHRLISHDVTTANLKWSFASSGEIAYDKLQVRFSTNKFE